MPKPKPQRGLDETKLPWEKRHVDPAIMMVWRSKTWVEPATKGDVGVIHYPDGKVQYFTRE